MTVEGHVAPGFEAVRAEFERNLRERGEIGAAMVAVVDGSVAVDLWGGTADRTTGAPWRRDTLGVLWSGTKGLVATCLLLLVERGQLDLDARVSRYWPEFAAAGKERTTVAELVSHRARVPALREDVTWSAATDPVAMARLLAAQEPLREPEAERCYHALTFGWLCDALIRRIDGRSTGRFFAEEVARPLGLAVWIGLPASEQHRVSRLELLPGFNAAPPPAGVSERYVRLMERIFRNPPVYPDPTAFFNDPAAHRAEIPGAGGVGSARSMARLYGCLARGGELDGIGLLRPSTLAVGRRLLAGWEDPYGGGRAFGVGYMLQTAERVLGPAREAFGHTGLGGSVHGAWPELATGFSYLPNGLSESDCDPRGRALLEALHSAVTARRTGPARGRRRQPA